MKVVTIIHKGKVQTISLDDLRNMKIELSNQWEGLCRKCGKCCFDKRIANKVLIIDYNSPCEHLKFAGRKALCSIYDKRFDICEKCNTIPEAIQNRNLPSDCPYIKNLPNYKAPVDNGNFYKRAKNKMKEKYKIKVE